MIDNIVSFDGSTNFIDDNIGMNIKAEVGRFTVHGSVELRVKDRILEVEGDGPWNIEAVTQANQSFSSLIKELSGSPWGALVVLQGDPIYVPDAADYLVNSIRSECQSGRVATAIMVENSNSPEFAKRHLSDIYKRAGCDHRFFSEKAEASWWLIQKITSAQGDV
ncbi:hypothetical protein [Paraglaciecola sp.]|uniref:hypothetical protein n=1 Tax=Paraglaciecola sp. TaxID=1920173 RepID=UPI003EFAA05C